MQFLYYLVDFFLSFFIFSVHGCLFPSCFLLFLCPVSSPVDLLIMQALCWVHDDLSQVDLSSYVLKVCGQEEVLQKWVLRLPSPFPFCMHSAVLHKQVPCQHSIEPGLFCFNCAREMFPFNHTIERAEPTVLGEGLPALIRNRGEWAKTNHFKLCNARQPPLVTMLFMCSMQSFESL